MSKKSRSLLAGTIEALDQFAERQRQSVVTIETHRANEQHYEVPAEFFELVLGARLKYSCGLWDDSTTSLDESEEAMLRLTCERAGIENGMRVLDLGCGWGSLSLWIAENYPECQITSLSNSSSQKAFIHQKCEQRGFHNIDVITADVGTFDTAKRFDRVVSVEMFEHVRNHEDLLSRIARWLVPVGNYSCISFATEIWLTRSRPRANRTGWAVISSLAGSCRRKICFSAINATCPSSSNGGLMAGNTRELVKRGCLDWMRKSPK